MILVLKITLLLLAGWTCATLLAKKAAAVRHLVWSLALAGSLALGLAAPVAPGIPVRVAAWPAPAVQNLFRTSDASAVSRSAVVEVPSRGVNTFGVAEQVPVEPTVDPRLAFLFVWAGGAVALAFWYLLGHLRVAALVRRAQPVEGEAWRALLYDAAVQSGVTRRISLVRSDAVGSPLTWGWLRRVIVLPSDADEWTLDRRRVVLAHEVAHSARGDFTAQLIAAVACTLYWFHPLVWVAARRLRLESEQACDDHVLLRGTSGVEYAAHLLEVARRSRDLRMSGAVAIGMARPSHLEGRLLAVLESGRPRRPARRANPIATGLGLAALVLPLSMLQPAARAAMDAVTPLVQSYDSTFEKSVSAPRGGRLDLDLQTGGNVTIRGWDEPRVLLRARLGGKDWSRTRVSLEPDGNRIVLRSTLDRESATSTTGHAFELMVPAEFDVRIESAGGGVHIVGVSGSFQGSTGGGEITIENAAGEAYLETGGGDVRVRDSELKGRVSTGGGNVHFSGVRGGLRGGSGSGDYSSFDGETRIVSRDIGRARMAEKMKSEDEFKRAVIVGEKLKESRIESEKREKEIRKEFEKQEKESRAELEEREKEYRKAFKPEDKGEALYRKIEGPEGMLHISKAGGSIFIESALDGAELFTGGGSVRVGKSGGFVNITTGGGDIEVGPLAGAVSASTGAGQVHVIISEARGDEYLVDVGSGKGEVILDLPANLNARFELETAYTERNGRTRIDSDWRLRQEETDEWDGRNGTPRKYVRMQGEVGTGGPLIRVRTVNGNITVRRRG